MLGGLLGPLRLLVGEITEIGSGDVQHFNEPNGSR